jgi:hypothetical protein
MAMFSCYFLPAMSTFFVFFPSSDAKMNADENVGTKQAKG